MKTEFLKCGEGVVEKSQKQCMFLMSMFVAATHFVLYHFENGDVMGAEVHFTIHPDIPQFTSINMQLFNSSNSSTTAIDEVTCTSALPFEGGHSYFCELQNLQPSTVYYVKLQGYNSDADDLVSGGASTGLTAWSHFERVETGIFQKSKHH